MRPLRKQSGLGISSARHCNLDLTCCPVVSWVTCRHTTLRRALLSTFPIRSPLFKGKKTATRTVIWLSRLTEESENRTPVFLTGPTTHLFSFVSFALASIGYYKNVTGKELTWGSPTQGSLRSWTLIQGLGHLHGKNKKAERWPWREERTRDSHMHLGLNDRMETHLAYSLLHRAGK